MCRHSDRFSPTIIAKLEEWIASLPAVQARRHYEPFGRDHDLIAVGRLLHANRTDGKVAVIDPDLPWNDCTVYLLTKEESQYQQDVLSGRHPGALMR